MAIITSSFPSEERGKAIGLLMTTVGVGMVAGPAVGGLLVDGLGWRSVFVAAIPVGLVGLSAAWLVLAERPGERQEPGRSQGFDWPGAALSTTALVAFLLGMTNGYRFGWYSPLVLAAMLGFVVLMAAFVRWELKTILAHVGPEIVSPEELLVGRIGQLAGLPGWLRGAGTDALLPSEDIGLLRPAGGD